MIRKSAVAVTAAAALALGTASATSLGSFNDVTFAASDAALLECSVTGDLLELLPDLPAVGETLADFSTAPLGTTFDLLSLDVTPLTSALSSNCVTDTVLDLVLLDSSGTVLDVVSVDPDGTGLGAVSLNQVIDVVSVAEIRAVLRDVTP